MLAQSGEYHWTVRVRLRCGSMSNHFSEREREFTFAIFYRTSVCLSVTLVQPTQPDGILPGAKFTLRPSLALSYIFSVTARHSSNGRQPTLRRWAESVTYFGRAAITFGIGPHSSSVCLVHPFNSKIQKDEKSAWRLLLACVICGSALRPTVKDYGREVNIMS